MRGFWISLASPEGVKGPVDWPAFSSDAPKRIVFQSAGITKIISDIDYRKARHCDLFTSNPK